MLIAINIVSQHRRLSVHKANKSKTMTLQRSGTAGVNCDFIKITLRSTSQIRQIIVFWDMWGNSVCCAKRAIRPNSWWISEDRYYRVIVVTKAKSTPPDHRPVLLKTKQNIRYFHSGHHREKAGWASMLFTFIVRLFVFAHTRLTTRCLRVRVKCLSPKQRGPQ